MPPLSSVSSSSVAAGEFSEIGAMTGGVSGDDRGFERGKGVGEWFFEGGGLGLSSVFGADFQGIKEKNCYLGREKFFPPMEKKTGQAMTMTPLTVGAFIFA